MLFSEKLSLSMILMTVFFLLISGNSGLEILVVLIVIGVLIFREMIDSFAPNGIKDRVNFFIYIGFIIFIGIVTRKIIYML